jgi:Domain of unknown function (DUF5615)
MSQAAPSIRFVLDEDVPAAVWQAVQDHNARGAYPLEVVQVGRLAALPKGTRDADLLIWAEQEGRVIVSRDRKTMTGHYADHLSAGRHSAGVLIISPTRMDDLIAQLALIAHTDGPSDWFDRIDSYP